MSVASGPRNPAELGVVGGLFGTRVAFVRVADIGAIDARAERIVLRPGARVRTQARTSSGGLQLTKRGSWRTAMPLPITPVSPKRG